jgi:hypothetical protein
MFGESCGFDWGNPGPGPIWCVFASRWSGADLIRMGGFVVDASYEGRPLPEGVDCVPLAPGELPTDPAHLLPPDEWISWGVVRYELSPLFSGPLEFRLDWAVDEFNRFEEKTSTITVNIPSVKLIPTHSLGGER